MKHSRERNQRKGDSNDSSKLKLNQRKLFLVTLKDKISKIKDILNKLNKLTLQMFFENDNDEISDRKDFIGFR